MTLSSKTITLEQFAKTIDHSLLKPELTEEEVIDRFDSKVKVIFENAYLNEEQKIAACHLCEEAGADWVKTSTGFAPSGATIADIELMRASVSDRVQVKAAHGVRTLTAALEMIDAGVTRIGATATAVMIEDFKKWREEENMKQTK